MTSGFQVQVYNSPAQAVAGDFASQNPRATFKAGPGGLVAGALGALIGRFAWAVPPVDPNGSNMIVNSFGAGSVAGFLAREQQGLNTTFLSDAGMTIPPGFMVTLFTRGDFWVVNDGSTEALVGQKAYANFNNGKVSFAAAGGSSGSASATSSSIAAVTSSVTGSIANDVMTVTAVGSGTLYNGTALSGSGVASGTKIVSQITPLLAGEAAGGIGRYLVNIDEQTVASTTITGTGGVFTVGTATGTFGVGDVLAGSGGGGVTTGTVITQLLTGTGGTGSTFAVDPTQTVTSSTITAVLSAETNFYALSTGLAGELVSIGTWQP